MLGSCNLEIQDVSLVTLPNHSSIIDVPSSISGLTSVYMLCLCVFDARSYASPLYCRIGRRGLVTKYLHKSLKYPTSSAP